MADGVFEADIPGQSVLLYSMGYALEIMFLFDETGRITYANDTAKRLLEYGDELCGTMVTDIFPGDFWIVDQGFETKCDFTPKVLHLMAYRKNRTCFSVEAKILRHGYDHHHFVCMAYDVTRQNLLEKRAAQADQEIEETLKIKSQFVANVTHELRTPVNGILGNTRELMNMEDREEKLQLLHLVERSCNDMHAIINNILDFSKLEAGKFILEQRQFHVRNMLDYVKSNHINKITEKGLDFFITVSPEVPEYIIGDELRIEQILNNLLSNATKFTSVGKIAVEVVKTAQIGNRVELFFMVIDSGIGIDKADQDKLFQSFSQVEASTTRKYGGTGLGLNISKQLVELMDGNIRVESEKGKGTLFSFHIWVELPQGEMPTEGMPEFHSTFEYRMPSLEEITHEEETIWKFGEADNLEEIEKKMSKLILSIEMDNWEKAEMFMETIKQLTNDAPREVKSPALRLKMAVQKGDHDKSVAAYDQLRVVLNEWKETGGLA